MTEEPRGLTLNVSSVQVVAGVSESTALAEAFGRGRHLVLFLVDRRQRHEVGAVGHFEVARECKMSHLY